MKVVILAGGFGTRISEESHLRPKPMVEIGDMPILWHVMKSYSSYGYNDFIICCGYKGYAIKEYFADYYLHNSDVTFDFSKENKMEVHNNVAEPWRVTLVDTGLNTMTGGRIRRIQKYLEGEAFMLTYGDGVCDVNIQELENFHNTHGKIATITAVQPGGRFGVIDVENDGLISVFKEKSKEDGGWINGGFMIFDTKIFEYLHTDQTILEKYPLEKLAEENQLMAYRHSGFWQCMDTLRDKNQLDAMIEANQAPWITW